MKCNTFGEMCVTTYLLYFFFFGWNCHPFLGSTSHLADFKFWHANCRLYRCRSSLFLDWSWLKLIMKYLQTLPPTKICIHLDLTIISQRTEVGVNLDFQAHLYGVAFLNPWNIPNKILSSLNSKIKFEIYSINC